MLTITCEKSFDTNDFFAPATGPGLLSPSGIAGVFVYRYPTADGYIEVTGPSLTLSLLGVPLFGSFRDVRFYSDNNYAELVAELHSDTDLSFPDYFSTTASTYLAGNDVIQGSTGADTLTSGDGADVLVGGGGADTMYGGLGDDTYDVDVVGDTAIDTGGRDTLRSSTMTTVDLASIKYVGVEDVLLAGSANLNAYGTDAANVLTGNNGNNILDGRGGADTMRGGFGNDTYYVDVAQDVIFDHSGNDTIRTSVVANISLASSNYSGIENVVLDGAANLNATGSALVNRLVGNTGNNVLNGAGGADVLQGQGGNDTYFVDNSGDLVFEAIGAGNDRVFASASFALGGGQSIEYLATTLQSGTAAINLTGNSQAQTISGNNGANVIDGGLGKDILYGHGGNDVFRFSTSLSSGNVDKVMDFSVPNDMIQLSRAVFTAFKATGSLASLSPGAFAVGTGATQADDRIIYNNATGALIYDSNGSAAGGAIEFARLAAGLATGGHPLSAADFAIIA